MPLKKSLARFRGSAGPQDVWISHMILHQDVGHCRFHGSASAHSQALLQGEVASVGAMQPGDGEAVTESGEKRGGDREWEEFSATFGAVMEASDDPVGMILRSHLWVERELTRLVERGLVQPVALDLQRLPFSLMLRLAQALGVVRDDFVPVLEELNKLRNRIAHQIDAEPDREDVERLWSMLPDYWRSNVNTAGPQETSFPARLRLLLMAVVVFLYVDRDNLTAFQEEQARGWREVHERLERLRQRLRDQAGGEAAGS